MSVPTRTLGRNGPAVPAVGLGLMSLGGVYGQQDSVEDTLKLLDRAHAIGERFWDTADVYHHSEDRVGEWFKKSGKRSDIFLASKFGVVVEGGAVGVRNDPEYVKIACETSLKRLGVETIDLYYLNDFRRLLPNYQKENFPRILNLVAKVKTIAEKHNASPAQVCLAWVQAQGQDIIPIPGTRAIKYLEKNTDSAHLKLSEDEVKELRRYAEETKLPGGRYPAMMMDVILKDSMPL